MNTNKIVELNNKYINGELSLGSGNKELRYNALSPLFENLYDNKVVYHERFTCIVKLQDIKLTHELFEAQAHLHLLIDPGVFRRLKSPPPEIWTVGANWAYLKLNGNYLSPYSSWLMWTDPVLVKKVEALVLKNNFDEALNMTMGDH